MLKFFLIATLLLCLSAGAAFFTHAEDIQEIEILERPPDGTNDSFYVVGRAHLKSGNSDAVTRLHKSEASGDLNITKAVGFHGDVHTARTIAIQDARLQMAEKLETRVTLSRDNLLSTITTDKTLIGARVIKTVITQEDGGHRVQVLMAMPRQLNVAHLSIEEMNKERDWTRIDEVERDLKAEAFDVYLATQPHSEKKDLDWQQTADATAVYPEWFWRPPVNLSFPTAVGYSSIASNSDLALEQAINNGIKNLAKQHHIHITGLIEGFLLIEDFLGEEFQGKRSEGAKLVFTSVFREETDAGVSEYVKTKHEILATHRGELGTIVLVSLDKESNLSTLAPDVNVTPPEWVTQLPSLPWYVYAHGVSSINQQPNVAWLEAEKDARAQLALSFKAKTSGTTEDTRAADMSSSAFSRVSETLTAVTLRSVETVSRWYDTQHRICHVLVRAPIIQNVAAVNTSSKVEDTSSKVEELYQDWKDWQAAQAYEDLLKALQSPEENKERQKDSKENEQNGQPTEGSDVPATQPAQ